MKKVAIVGAGVVGYWIANELLSRNYEVTLFDMSGENGLRGNDDVRFIGVFHRSAIRTLMEASYRSWLAKEPDSSDLFHKVDLVEVLASGSEEFNTLERVLRERGVPFFPLMQGENYRGLKLPGQAAIQFDAGYMVELGVFLKRFSVELRLAGINLRRNAMVEVVDCHGGVLQVAGKTEAYDAVVIATGRWTKQGAAKGAFPDLLITYQPWFSFTVPEARVGQGGKATYGKTVDPSVFIADHRSGLRILPPFDGTMRAYNANVNTSSCGEDEWDLQAEASVREGLSEWLETSPKRFNLERHKGWYTCGPSNAAIVRRRGKAVVVIGPSGGGAIVAPALAGMCAEEIERI